MYESLAVVRCACLGAAVGLALLLGAPATAEVPGWARNTVWAEAMDWARSRLADCKALADREFAVPCEGFTAEALAQVYAIDDFLRSDGHLTGRQILENLQRAESGWILLGSAAEQDALETAQARANDSLPVIAAYAGGWRGHAALILPGSGYPSQTWGLRVPNSASFFASRAARSYVGKSLSFAFGKDIKDRVMIYYRPRREEPEPPVQEAATPGPSADEVPQQEVGPAPSPSTALEVEENATAASDPEPSVEETAAAESDEATVALEQRPEPSVSEPPVSEPPVGEGSDEAMAGPTNQEAGDSQSLGLSEEPLPSEELPAEAVAAPTTTPESQAAAVPDQRDATDLVATNREAYRILKDQMAGTWCAVGGPDDDKLRAFLINPEAGLLSRGEIDLREPVSFRSLDSRVIVDVKGDAEIIGITYAKENRMSDSMTAFFVLNSRNRMFESHVFDSTNNRILDRGDTWERCSDNYALPRQSGSGSG